MVKIVSKKETTTSLMGQRNSGKSRQGKKQKPCLSLSRPKKMRQKAEKKITKMQEELETYRMQVHKFEAKLSEIRLLNRSQPWR